MKQEKILYNIKQESQPSSVVEKFNAVPTVVSGGYINWGVSPHLEVNLIVSVAKWLCTKLLIWDTGVRISSLTQFKYPKTHGLNQQIFGYSFYYLV